MTFSKKSAESDGVIYLIWFCVRLIAGLIVPLCGPSHFYKDVVQAVSDPYDTSSLFIRVPFGLYCTLMRTLSSS